MTTKQLLSRAKAKALEDFKGVVKHTFSKKDSNLLHCNYFTENGRVFTIHERGEEERVISYEDGFYYYNFEAKTVERF